MIIKYFNTIVLLFLPHVIYGQVNSEIHLKKVITYYKNGNIQKFETYRADSCLIYDVSIDEFYYVDSCKDGLIKEWYANGNLKTIGQYEYITSYSNKAEILNILKNHPDTIRNSYSNYHKTGIWYAYDSLGHTEKISRYQYGREIFITVPRKEIILDIVNDSIQIKLYPYLMVNAYIIRRKNNNKKLIIEPYETSNHNYWVIYDKKKELLSRSTTLYNSFYEWDKPLFFLKHDDTPPNKNYPFDLSKLPNGRYYIYHWSPHGVFYELEIILESI